MAGIDYNPVSYTHLTVAMSANVLRASGYRVGMFISPFVLDFRERIQVNGEMIPLLELTRLTEKISRAAVVLERNGMNPNEFEVVTAIGMLYFDEQHCDIVCLEVGLGGTYDATNVISPPLDVYKRQVGSSFFLLVQKMPGAMEAQEEYWGILEIFLNFGRAVGVVILMLFPKTQWGYIIALVLLTFSQYLATFLCKRAITLVNTYSEEHKELEVE